MKCARSHTRSLSLSFCRCCSFQARVWRRTSANNLSIWKMFYLRRHKPIRRRQTRRHRQEIELKEEREIKKRTAPNLMEKYTQNIVNSCKQYVFAKWVWVSACWLSFFVEWFFATFWIILYFLFVLCSGFFFQFHSTLCPFHFKIHVSHK